MDDIIHFTPHEGNKYVEDNAKVFRNCRTCLPVCPLNHWSRDFNIVRMAELHIRLFVNITWGVPNGTRSWRTPSPMYERERGILLRSKLWMMGIPMDNPCFINSDNQSVLWNTTKTESVLKKKSNSVVHYFVREEDILDEWITYHIKTQENPSDILTKSLPAGLN